VNAVGVREAVGLSRVDAFVGAHGTCHNGTELRWAMSLFNIVSTLVKSHQTVDKKLVATTVDLVQLMDCTVALPSPGNGADAAVVC
jgi:hypothetical protein